MITLETASFLTPSLMATCACARFWSKRVKALKFSSGIVGAYFLQMNAFVFAGLPEIRGRGERRKGMKKLSYENYFRAKNKMEIDTNRSDTDVR